VKPRRWRSKARRISRHQDHNEYLAPTRLAVTHGSTKQPGQPDRKSGKYTRTSMAYAAQIE
ncbi:unnamed protein product, partial [Pylaiella littoralis]